MNNTLTVLVSIPGAGKSTWANAHELANPNAVVISSDSLRAVFGTGEEDQTVSAKVFDFILPMAQYLLMRGRDVIIDATNLTPKRRKPFVDLARNMGCKIRAIYFIISCHTCLERNMNRARIVPADVIIRMNRDLVEPFYSEGFDDIQVIREE